MYRILVNLVLLVVGYAPVLSAQAIASDTVRLRRASSDTLSVEQSLVLGPDVLDVGLVTAVTSSRDGRIVVVDWRDSRLRVFSTNGQPLTSFGGRGEGPGEFRQVSSVGWLADTLVILDRQMRRITLVLPGQRPEFKTFNWVGPGRPIEVVGAGARAAVLSAQTPTPSRGSVAVLPLPIERRVRAISLAGLAPPPPLVDRAPDVIGNECEDREGRIHILAPLIPPRGPLRALTSGGDYVVAQRDNYALLVSPISAQRSPRLLLGPVQPSPIGDAAWDSLARAYRTIERQSGPLKCNPPFDRPLTFPIIQAVQADDQDRLWIELLDANEYWMHVVSTNGAILGRFRMPHRDVRVPWHVRHNRLYLIDTDDDDLQSVRVFSIRGLGP